MRYFSLLFVLLSLYAFSAAQTVGSCKHVSAPESVTISLDEAQYILADALKKKDFKDIPSSRLKDQIDFDRGHPDRSNGYTSPGMKISKLNGQKVVIKNASQREIQFAYALDKLGMSPQFHGTAHGGRSYVISFIPDAVLIKAGLIDERIDAFIKKGFRLKKKSKEKIILMFTSLAQLGIDPWDANFLISMSGDVYLIDPGHFLITNQYSALQTVNYTLTTLESTFRQIEELQSAKRVKTN